MTLYCYQIRFVVCIERGRISHICIGDEHEARMGDIVELVFTLSSLSLLFRTLPTLSPVLDPFVKTRRPVYEFGALPPIAKHAGWPAANPAAVPLWKKIFLYGVKSGLYRNVSPLHLFLIISLHAVLSV